jgi:hypothetical protein
MVVNKLRIFSGNVEFLGHQVRDALANKRIRIELGSVDRFRKIYGNS